VATLKQLDHPNIVKLIDEIIVDNKVSFVLEFCSGPELSKYLNKREHLE
jgi:serine/threonine protein kinase